MRIILSLLIIVAIPLSAYGIVGLADWQETTPNGLIVNNFTGGVTVHLDNSHSVQQVESWYFYKDFIIGFTDTTWEIIDPVSFESLQNQPSYFVIQEKTRTLFSFTSYLKWMEFLEKKELKPKFWTRWYRSDWSFFNDQIFMLFIFGGFLIAVPILIVYLICVYRMIKKDKYQLKGINTRIVLISTALFWGFWLFDQIPQSI